jgi:hypothetical protein
LNVRTPGGAAVVIALYETEPADRGGVLYRALRSDVRHPWAVVRDAGDALREAGTPDVAGGVVLIEPFAVPSGAEDEFLAAWERLRSARALQRGYLGSRLHPGHVDFTRWSSPLMHARSAKLREVQEAAATMPFPSEPALYLPAG